MPNHERKVALVTGGNSGIGRATALAFAREGARVIIAARRADLSEATAHEIVAAGGEAIAVRADMGKTSDIEAMVEKTVEHFGRLDYAVNNAASAEGLKPLTDCTDEDFDVVIGVNLKGVWCCMKHEIKQMLKQNPSGGAIVNVSSINGLGGAAGGAIYSASKAGVIALSKSAAQECGHQGVRINALAAGAFRTPMLQHAFEQGAGGDPERAQAAVQRMVGMIPLKRIGQPEEAAETILWLCSDAASYVTGHSMIVDGGLTSWAR